ncbi:hypothetical protein MTO96_013842 [Rhipicephalus appendiculatus]
MRNTARQFGVWYRLPGTLLGSRMREHCAPIDSRAVAIRCGGDRRMTRPETHSTRAASAGVKKLAADWKTEGDRFLKNDRLGTRDSLCDAMCLLIEAE